MTYQMYTPFLEINKMKIVEGSVIDPSWNSKESQLTETQLVK